MFMVAAKLRHWLLRTTFHRPLSQGILNKRQPGRTTIFERYCGCWPLQDTGSSVLTVKRYDSSFWTRLGEKKWNSAIFGEEALIP